MNQFTKYKACLKLFGFEAHPEEITQQLGLQPDQSGVKGEPYQVGSNQLGNRTWTKNHWEIASKIATDRTLEDHVAHILDTIRALKTVLQAIIQANSGEVSEVCYMYEGCNPGFHLSKEQMKEITELDLELDVDVYCLDRQTL